MQQCCESLPGTTRRSFQSHLPEPPAQPGRRAHLGWARSLPRGCSSPASCSHGAAGCARRHASAVCRAWAARPSPHARSAPPPSRTASYSRSVPSVSVACRSHTACPHRTMENNSVSSQIASHGTLELCAMSMNHHQYSCWMVQVHSACRSKPADAAELPQQSLLRRRIDLQVVLERQQVLTAC